MRRQSWLGIGDTSNAISRCSCAGFSGGQQQSRAYSHVGSSLRSDSPDRTNANGYDSDGMFNGAPATAAAHHSSPRNNRSGGTRAPRPGAYGGIPPAPEAAPGGAGGAGGFSGFGDGECPYISSTFETDMKTKMKHFELRPRMEVKWQWVWFCAGKLRRWWKILIVRHMLQLATALCYASRGCRVSHCHARCGHVCVRVMIWHPFLLLR